jgi:hypothetical protein
MDSCVDEIEKWWGKLGWIEGLFGSWMTMELLHFYNALLHNTDGFLRNWVSD